MNVIIVEWLYNWFEENNGIQKEELSKNLNENYFAKGWLDSFGFITFITDIEDTFEVSFSNDEFQDRNFATINGIAAIIERKQNEK